MRNSNNNVTVLLKGAITLTRSQYPQTQRVPSHVMGFSCSRCTRCCTNKWRIEIDDTSYEKLYDQYSLLGRQQKLYKNISVETNGRFVRFASNGNCVFLDDNNLCSIQVQLGQEFLPDVCKLYPRRVFASKRGWELALSLSCRTAVDTLLHHPITITELPYAAEQPEPPFYFARPNTFKWYFPENQSPDDIRHHYYRLENSLVQILQRTEYSVGERLIMVAAAGCSSCPQALPPDKQLGSFRLFCQKYLSEHGSGRSSQLLRSLLLVVALDTILSLEEATFSIRLTVPPLNPAQYLQTLEKYYFPAQKDVSPLLENYLVNFVLSKHFFFQTFETAYLRMTFLHDAVIFFAVAYAIITRQVVNKPLLLQAIYDVENIFYENWFYAQPPEQSFL
ncbi:flagellin lysine-N-methylase [Sporomusa sphaeroides]|uniref:flagellin lysine-N-methylase n=1 Tax=Sporomusa sphaeroides TaxID=47679 RepID=UPI0031590BA8